MLDLYLLNETFTNGSNANALLTFVSLALIFSFCGMLIIYIIPVFTTIYKEMINFLYIFILLIDVEYVFIFFTNLTVRLHLGDNLAIFNLPNYLY